MNFTMFFEPSKECFDWCKEAHFAYNNNLEIKGIFIIAFAAFVIFSYITLKKYYIIENYVEIKTDDYQLKKIINLLPHLTFYLLIGFIIWFIWFS